MDRSILLAKALIEDYANPVTRKKIEDAKTEAWQDPNSFWQKILANQMHAGSNKTVLEKRMSTDEYRAASYFNRLVYLDESSRKELLSRFVPGGRHMNKEKKVRLLLQALEYIGSKGFQVLFCTQLSKDELLNNLKAIPGVGAKQSRNVLMDLYHPEFRNGSIPIDANWKRIAEYLGRKWTNSEKHEKEIIEWRDKYVGRNIIKEDWEFDRLVYWALNDVSSNVRKIIL